MARNLAWIASVLTIVGCGASPRAGGLDEPAGASAAAEDGPPDAGAIPVAAAAAIDAVALPDEPEPALSMSTLIAMGRPLPEDAPASMSLDPLADALPERKAAKPEDLPVEVNALAPTATATATPRETSEPPPRLPAETIQNIVRRNFGRFRGCYREALHRDARVGGKIVVRFELAASGLVTSSRALDNQLKSAELTVCVLSAFEAIEFPALPEGSPPSAVTYPIVFAKSDAEGSRDPASSMRPRTTAPKPPEERPQVDPRRGAAKVVYDAIARGDVQAAEASADAALRGAATLSSRLLVGDAARAAGDTARAVRAYRSIAAGDGAGPPELRIAGARLLTLGATERPLAEKMLLRSLGTTPSDPRALLLLASSRAAGHDPWGALALLDAGFERATRGADARGVRQLFRRQMGLYARVVVALEPDKKKRVERWLSDVGAELDDGPTTLIVSAWESDGADLDMTVTDATRGTASFAMPALATGGAFLSGGATSPGIESFRLDNALARRAYPYDVAIVYARGTADPVAGVVSVVEQDGAGELTVKTTPILMDVPNGSEVVVSLAKP